MFSGKTDYFDYSFERKIDRGNFPFDHINYTNVLDLPVDHTCEQYL